jgi:hypothetical protein
MDRGFHQPLLLTTVSSLLHRRTIGWAMSPSRHSFLIQPAIASQL